MEEIKSQSNNSENPTLDATEVKQAPILHETTQQQPQPSSSSQIETEVPVVASVPPPSHSNATVAVSSSSINNNNSSVIEILSDSDDDNNNNSKSYDPSNNRKRQRVEISAGTRNFSHAHHHFHGNHLANGGIATAGGVAVPRPPLLATHNSMMYPQNNSINSQQILQYNHVHHEMQQRQQRMYREPYYLPLPSGFVPTWNRMLPNDAVNFIRQCSVQSMTLKSYQLSLLNVSEFTITGLSTGYNTPPTSVSGLRSHIKQISKKHGKAVWQRNSDTNDDEYDDDGGGGIPEGEAEAGGKWRIPLGAYHAFYTFLKSDPMTIVEGIPEIQLKIASLGRARLTEGFPPVDKLLLI